jgi:formylmethanofuran dehydrogenase subunit A
MTADGPFQYQLYLLSGNKWTNSDVEAETGAGIVPFTYKRSNYVNAVQWAIGLELALLIKDPWKVFLTTDHPNGGPFTAYPRVISWLMSKEARAKILKKIPRNARRRTNLKNIDRELSFNEIAIMTRAATAKALGLKHKGHLGAGADADVAVYPINPHTANPSKDVKAVLKALRNAYYVLKEGQIIVNKGEIVRVVEGKTFWVKPRFKADLMESVISELKSKFENYYTVKMENYPIPGHYLNRSAPIHTEAA